MVLTLKRHLFDIYNLAFKAVFAMLNYISGFQTLACGTRGCATHSWLDSPASVMTKDNLSQIWT